MKQLLALFVFLLGAAEYHSVQAQFIVLGNSFSDNRSECSISVRDKENGEPLVGAVVEIICKADTLRGITVKRSWAYGPDAVWECNKIFRDSVELRVNYLGYKEYKERCSAENFRSYYNIKMEIDATQIAQVVVMGEQVAMVFRGDTTVYNAGAFKTFSDDRFAELLKQLPGVEIRDNKIFAEGQEVKRVYVDGRNLFGSNASFALTDMEASDVKSVRVYEELSPEARHMGDESAQKEKVMDVETKSKRKVLIGGELGAIGGMSFEKDYSGHAEIRHSESGSFYRHSEKGNITVSGSNSKDATGTGYEDVATKITPSKRTGLNGSYEYRRGDTTRISTFVNFSRDKSSSLHQGTTDYFPTADYNLRRSESLSEIAAKTLSTRIGNFSAFMRGKNHIMMSANIDYNQAERMGLNRTNQEISYTKPNTDPSLETTKTQTNTNNKDRGIAADINLGYVRRFKKGHINFSVKYGHNNQNRDGWRIDTLASTPGLRVKLNDDGRSRQHTLNSSVDYSHRFSKKSQLSASYDFGYDYSKSRQLAIDFLEDPRGVLDTINSYDYTVNYYTNSISLDYRYSTESLHFSASLQGSLYNLARTELFPAAEHLPRSFFQLAPSVRLMKKIGKNRLHGGISSSPQMPSAEMLRGTLNATNPLSLQAGNPDLKMPNNVSASFNYEITKPEKARYISFGIGGSYTFNYITSRRTLFTEDTYLPQYNYTAQRGAQLNSQVNVGGNYNLNASARISQQIKSMRSTFTASISYLYHETPYFIDSLLSNSLDHSLTVSAGLSTGFSNKVKINIGTATTMRAYTTQNEIAYDLREHLNLRIDLRFGKYFGFITTGYEYYTNTRSKELTRHNALTNISAGRKFGKGDQFALSIGATDIFNRPNNTNTNFQTDYVNTNSVSYLGRYGFIKAAYTF